MAAAFLSLGAAALAAFLGGMAIDWCVDKMNKSDVARVVYALETSST